MRQYLFFGLILILLSNCKTTKDYKDIFGKWTVVDAKYLQAEKWKGKSNVDTKALADNYLRYIYVFNIDSTFQRGKPDVRHLNVEEAHGKFSVKDNKKVMRWYLQWTDEVEIDTVDIEILKMTNSTMVLLEAMGGGNKMEHTLERVEK
jgi:hypothetical protein